jgi:hypothetical protein
VRPSAGAGSPWIRKRESEEEPQTSNPEVCATLAFKICGEGPYPKTFLLSGQPAKGESV